MVITWRDTDLKSHTIKLDNAVDVIINGIEIDTSKKGIAVRARDGVILVRPVSSNYALIEKEIF